MSYTLGLVEITPHSCWVTEGGEHRLAGRSFGGRSLLEWVVRRVSDTLLIDRTAVVVPPEVQGGIEYLVPPDIALFTVDGEEDSLSSTIAAAQHFKADAVVRVGVDNPFIDPVLIDRLVATAAQSPQASYVGYCSHDGQPLVHSRMGMIAEWYSVAALNRVDAMASDDATRRDFAQFICDQPEEFQLRLIPAPMQLDHNDLRLTIDVEEDWVHAQEIFEALGPEDLDWQRIAGLLDQQPLIRKRMANLNRQRSST